MRAGTGEQLESAVMPVASGGVLEREAEAEGDACEGAFKIMAGLAKGV